MQCALQISGAGIQALGQVDRVPELISACLEVMASYVNSEFDEDTELEKIGFNSIDAVEIVADINTRLGATANPTNLPRAAAAYRRATSGGAVDINVWVRARVCAWLLSVHGV